MIKTIKSLTEITEQREADYAERLNKVLEEVERHLLMPHNNGKTSDLSVFGLDLNGVKPEDVLNALKESGWTGSFRPLSSSAFTLNPTKK